MTNQMSGLRKAAVLLVQLGKERSAQVLSQLRESEVEELSAEIVRLGRIEAETADQVLSEFSVLAEANRDTGLGGLDFARDVLQASLGEDRAGDLIDRLSAALEDAPFSFLQRADTRQVLSFLADEHPQTIALVLAHVTAQQASDILASFAPALQADVAHRIAVMDRTSPEIIRQVERMLERKLSSVLQPADLSTVGGIQPLVDIINRADRTTERLILQGLDSLDPKLAEEVRGRMFVFEDIVSLEDRAMQLVLRQVDAADLASALKGVREDVRDKVMRNMSERAAENLADEIEMLGSVRLKVVEEAQAKVVQEIQALETSGQLVIQRGDGDEFVS
jgi:flagellar motor switch protein FliG